VVVLLIVSFLVVSVAGFAVSIFTVLSFLTEVLESTFAVSPEVAERFPLQAIADNEMAAANNISLNDVFMILIVKVLGVNNFNRRMFGKQELRSMPIQAEHSNSNL